MGGEESAQECDGVWGSSSVFVSVWGFVAVDALFGTLEERRRWARCLFGETMDNGIVTMVMMMIIMIMCVWKR